MLQLKKTAGWIRAWAYVDRSILLNARSKDPSKKRRITCNF